MGHYTLVRGIVDGGVHVTDGEQLGGVRVSRGRMVAPYKALCGVAALPPECTAELAGRHECGVCAVNLSKLGASAVVNELG